MPIRIEIDIPEGQVQQAKVKVLSDGQEVEALTDVLFALHLGPQNRAVTFALTQMFQGKGSKISDLAELYPGAVLKTKP